MAEDRLVSELKSAVHGEIIGKGGKLICDFCDSKIQTDEPVMYDCIKVEDMPNLEKLLDIPDGWLLDASRCTNCEVETVDPATDGYAEAVVIISVNESAEAISVDATTLTVVDYSPSPEGYHPPMTDPRVGQMQQDYGIARWARLKGLLDCDPPEQMKQILKNQFEISKEVPPGISIDN